MPLTAPLRPQCEEHTDGKQAGGAHAHTKTLSDATPREEARRSRIWTGLTCMRGMRARNPPAQRHTAARSSVPVPSWQGLRMGSGGARHGLHAWCRAHRRVGRQRLKAPVRRRRAAPAPAAAAAPGPARGGGRGGVQRRRRLWCGEADALLPAGGAGGRRLVRVEAAAVPVAPRQRAVHAEVVAEQLAVAQHAGRGAAQRAVLAHAPNDQVRAGLAAHPGRDGVRSHAVQARTVLPAGQQPALCACSMCSEVCTPRTCARASSGRELRPSPAPAPQGQPTLRESSSSALVFRPSPAQQRSTPHAPAQQRWLLVSTPMVRDASADGL